MRRISMFLASALVGAFAVAGCGSDADNSHPSQATQCIASYSDFSVAAFNAQLASGKACSADGDSICSRDVTGIVGNCGSNCYINLPHDDETQAGCVRPCIEQAVTSPKALSSGCIDCYVSDVACARDHCFKECGLTPSAAACIQCRADNGCAAGFYGCSGLPLPTGVELGDGSAGASGSGN